MARSVSDIKKELLAAEERERTETRARKEATPPKFEYWIVPANIKGTRSFDKLYDPTCLLYELNRKVMNKDDARAVGWADNDMTEGSGIYLYNIVTRRIVCAVGGGTYYIGTSNIWNGADDFADDTALFRLGGYLAEFPGGGNITYIVEDFKAERKASSNGHKPANASA